MLVPGVIFRHPPLTRFTCTARGEKRCLDLQVFPQPRILPRAGGSEGQINPLPQLSRLETPRKGSIPAEARHMAMHTHGPKQPLQSRDCISDRNATNSWAAGPSWLSTQTQPASAPAPAPASRTEAALGGADRDNLPLGPWGGHQCLCGQGHFLSAPSTKKKRAPFPVCGKGQLEIQTGAPRQQVRELPNPESAQMTPAGAHSWAAPSHVPTSRQPHCLAILFDPHDHPMR